MYSCWTVHGTGCGDVTITNCKFKNVTCGIGIVGNYNENIESDTIIAVKKCSFTGTSNSSSDRRYNNTAILINNSNRLYNAVIENNTVNGMGYFFVFANESYASSWFDPYGKGCYARTKNNTINNAYFQAVYVDNMCGKKYQEMYSYTSENDKILQAGEEGYSLNNTMGYLKASSTSNGYVKNCTKRGVALSGAVVDVSGIDITQNKGGGVSTDNNSTLKLRSGRIYDNDVAGNGGGLLNNGITDIYDFFRIKENTATGNGEGIYQNGGLTLHDSVTIDTSNDIYLAADKIINMDATVDSISSFTGRITPSQYTPGRICVYAVNDNINGSYFGDSFTLTPKSPYLLRGGNLISGITTYKKDYKLLISRTYDITYDANGGTNAPAVQKKYWKENTTLSTKIPTKNSYLFNGWNTEEDGSGDDYFPGDTYSENEALYLYAQWTPIKYTVAYNGNGSTSGSMLAQTFTYGKSYNLAANGFVKSNYHFAGWNTKADGSGTSYADKQSVKNLASTHGAKITLYAQWVKSTYTICFHANGGIGSMADVTVPYDTSYKLPANKFTYQGYTFDKWKTEDGTSVYGNEAAIKYSSSQLKNGVLNLYAQWKINQYTLTITGDSGVETITGSGTYNYDTTANVTYQIKPGYHIKNITGTTADGDPNGVWTGHTGKGGTVNDTWTVKACNRTIVVHTEPNTYTVKYDGNGNTGGSTGSSNHTYGTAKALTANGYTKTGYSFNGWNTKADGRGTAYADKASVKNLSSTNGATVTLYAQWTASKYTVTYNANGGSGTMETDKATYGAGYVTKANAFSRTGYTFVGWNEKADGTGTDWTSWIGKSWTWTYTKNITLYAQWTKNSYYLDLNGVLDDKSAGNITGYGTADIYVDGVQKANDVTDFYQKIPYGSKYEIKDIKVVTGHTYVGVHSGSITGTIGTSNVGVVLEFKTNKYTVTFDKNNGTGTMKDQTFTYGVKQALTVNAFSRTGYTFTGWNTKADGSGTTYTDKQEVTSLTAADGATITLYAQWKINSYTLTYDPNGGTVTPTSKTLTYGSQYGALPTPSRTGYTFTGWFTAASGGSKVGTATTMGAGNTTIYAHWRANVLTVNYYPNGATKVDTSSVADGSAVSTIDSSAKYRSDTFNYDASLPSYGLWDARRFIRTGYTSTNKYHANSVTGTILLDAGNNVYTKTQDLASAVGKLLELEKGDVTISIYADWKANAYTVKYNGNGNTGGSTAGSSHTYDTAKGLTANGFTKTGYTFKNWNTKADGSGTSYADKASVKNLTATAGGTVNLYAQWTANKYTVTYNANGGTGTMANQELTYNKAATLNANTFKRTGYRFSGWNTKADGTGTSYADKASVKNLTANSGGTVTLYAKWYSAAPELEAKDATYYEGQNITKAMLLKNVTKASDVEDGDMTGKVIITKIEYSAGKLVDGKPQAAYTKSWTNGMPDSEKLDTWFQQLPKEKAPVTHKITYQVTDLSGKTTTKTSTITVKYNEFPVIKAEDRYFTMEDAKAGKITQDVLLKDAITSGKLKATDAEDGTINNRITIVDYKDTDFKNVNGNTVVWVTFKVKDSMGKETIQEIKVNVIDSGSDYWRDDDGTARKQVRFITQKYYDKNKDTDFHGMTSEEIEASSDNGGLNVMSKWYQNAAYKALLTGSFAKDAGTDYKISAEKAKELKQKIESNGIGNSKSSNALTDIYNSLK